MAKTVRVSLVFPSELWEEIKEVIPAGERSRVIAEATEREIEKRRRQRAFEQVCSLGDELKLRYGEMPSCVEEIRQMRDERDADISGLR